MNPALNALSLTQLSQYVSNAIRQVPQNVWVTAEIVDLRSSGGHGYMELLEKDAKGATVAKMRANIWRNSLDYIRRKFYAATGHDLSNGIKVMLCGTVIYHQQYGIAFSVSDIDPSYTLGDLERLRREILERLHREGILNLNKQIAMPAAPQRIAVISAAGAAGYGDFINQLADSPEHLQFYPCLFPAVMQGDKTSMSVREALARIEMSVDFWDCVVIIRGGGATSDLNGFDDYELAKTVATYPLPVIVGIGHERDRTVLDEIACVRCKTPTAVAAYLIDALRGALRHSYEVADSITRIAQERIAYEKQRLAQFATMTPTLATQRLSAARMALDYIGKTLPQLATNITTRETSRLDMIAQRIRSASEMPIMRGHQQLESIMQQLRQSTQLPIDRQRQTLTRISSLIEVLSPDNTLRRGYSITRHDGKAVRDASTLPPGTRIETILHSGSIISVVTD